MSPDLAASLAPSLAETAIKMAVTLALLINVVPVMLWVERRGSALMQDRPGPNRLGPLGLFQGLADAMKFMFKEDVTPAAVDRVMFLSAPVLALLPALTTFSVIPFGPDLLFHGRTIPLLVADTDAGVLLFLALASLGVYGLVMAGYGSNNKFSLLGSIRASAQLISYELALTLSVVAAILPVGSFRLPDVIAYQQAHTWSVLPQILGFGVFVVASFAETNRLPFDLSEAESELIAGFHTEYSAMRFATFFMAEYISMTSLAALGVTLYFGGWTLPGVHLGHGWIGALLGLAILMAKVGVALAVFVWVRWTFPRFRYDQLMRLGWKVLLPIAIANLVLVAVLTLAGKL
jgi:NADH-quinone oxidoreductase subunit H